MFQKAPHKKWPFVTIDQKGDTCRNSEVRSTVVKRLDWQRVEREWQKQGSQLCGVGEVDCLGIFP